MEEKSSVCTSLSDADFIVAKVGGATFYYCFVQS